MMRFLFLLVFLSLSMFKLSATHMAGADVRYYHVSGTKYKVVAKVYRLCNGIALNNPSGMLVVSNASGTSCGDIALSWTRTAIRDIATYCDTAKKCWPANQWVTSQGFEEHTYEVDVDLSNSSITALLSSSCNIITFVIYQCCRDNQITTSKSDVFWSTATLYYGTLSTLSVKTNTSPYFLKLPGINFCCNTPVYQDFEARDTTNGDLLIYKLVPAHRTFNTSVNYNSPWSGTYPLTPYCPGNPGKVDCAPNPNKSLPEGIYFDTLIGEFIYTPTKCNEVGPVCVEVSEYRKVLSKWVLVGKMRRDILIKSRDCGQNRAPEIICDSEYEVCLGDTFCLEVKTMDTFKNNMGNYDTLKITWSTNVKNAVITTSGKNVREPSLKFCWITDNSDYNANGYSLKLEVRDQNCPIPTVSFKHIKLKVKKTAKPKILSTRLSCNRLQLQATNISVINGKFQWYLFETGTGDTVFSSQLSAPVIQGLQAGTYVAQLNLSSAEFCEISPVNDTIHITTQLPYTQLQGDTLLCENSQLVLSPVSLNHKAPLTHQWYRNQKLLKENGSTLNLIVRAGKDTVAVHVTDSFGCVTKAGILITGRNKPAMYWTTDTLEQICFSGNNIPLSPYLNEPVGLVQSTVNASDSVPVVRIHDVWNYQLSALKSCTYSDTGTWVSLYASGLDSAGCTSTDTACVKVICKPFWQMKNDTICQAFSNYYLLKNLSPGFYEPAEHIHHFRLLKWPQGVDSVNVISDNSGNGTNWKLFAGFHRNAAWYGPYTIEGCKTRISTGCVTCDTSIVEVIGNSEYAFNRGKSYCTKFTGIDLWSLITENGNDFNGMANCSIHSVDGNTDSSSWQGAKIADNRYFFHNNKFGKWVFLLTEKNANCVFTDTFSVIFHPSPEADFTTSPKDSTPISSAVFQTNNLSVIPGGSNLLNNWDPGTGNINDRSNAKNPVFVYPGVPASYVITLETVSTKGCRDTAMQFVYIYDPSVSLESPTVFNFKLNQKLQILDVEYSAIQKTVYNPSGQLIYTSIQNNEVALPPGMYQFIIIWTDLERVQHVIKGKWVVPE